MLNALLIVKLRVLMALGSAKLVANQMRKMVVIANTLIKANLLPEILMVNVNILRFMIAKLNVGGGEILVMEILRAVPVITILVLF